MQSLVPRPSPLIRETKQSPDSTAIYQWLAEYRDKETTFRSYQKEAERFLLWCHVELKKSLAQLSREDFETYFEFLKNPQPAEMWCAPKGSKARVRGTTDWRPFVGPLSGKAIAHAIIVLNSMMGYLVDARYLTFNPLSLMRRKSRVQNNISERHIQVVERILEDDEWEAILKALTQMPGDSPHQKDDKERLQFLIAILFFLGLRIHELQTHKWDAFKKIQGDWWFFVRGKGDKLAKIPVNDQLLQAVQRFRTHLRVSPLPEPSDTGPLIPSWRSNQPLTARQMSKLLKNLALQAATQFAHQPDKVNKLKRFSPHWLRHLSASMQDRAGVSFKHVKANHRHMSDETTRLYVHAMDKERHDDMQKLKLPVIQ